MTKSHKEMTEAELAQYHEAHMDDESLWKKPGRAIRSRRGQGPSVTFTIRLTGDELTRIAQAAYAQGTNPSHFIRSAALQALETPGEDLQRRQKALEEARSRVKELDAVLRQL